MHFSIPDTHELYADTTAATTTYTVYNIYINGNYHACLRYKQLHALHKQLRGQCAFEPEIHLPEFPPKRLLPLTNGQLETRRSALEHYLQLIGQDPRIARMPFFQQFLLRAQIDTALSECTIESDNECKKLEVLLATDTYDHNGGTGYQLQVNCCVNQNSSALLRNVGHALKLSPAMLQYFCLYLVRVQRPTQDSDDGDEDTLVLLRRLMDFESPYISRLHADPCQLMLRKCYWNPTWDLKLQRDPVALNLLYLQTVGDVTREWIIATPDVRHKLRSLEEHGMKKEYLEMARHLPLYGCLQFNTAIVDYPDPETSAIISIGNRELSIRTPRGAKIYETKFRVTRMRCWRVSAMHNTFESRDHPTHLQLSFEYLMSKQTLRWITITSTEAMLMSVSLQSMVDELLNSGGSNESGDELEMHSNTARNGRTSASASSSSASSTPSSSTSTTASTCMPSTSSSSVSANYMSSYMSNSSNLSTPVSPTPPVQFLAQRVAPSSKQQNKLTTSSTFSAVFFRNNDSVSHNEAFEGIGDDDL